MASCGSKRRPGRLKVAPTPSSGWCCLSRTRDVVRHDSCLTGMYRGEKRGGELWSEVQNYFRSGRPKVRPPNRQYAQAPCPIRMDPHSSPLSITVRQTSAKTYGRSFSQRRRAPVPAAAPSAGSVIASTTGGGRARSGARSTSASTRQTSNGRLQLPEDLSSDDEEVESKRPRRGELSKGKEAPERSTFKRGASALAKAPIACQCRQSRCVLAQLRCQLGPT